MSNKYARAKERARQRVDVTRCPFCRRLHPMTAEQTSGKPVCRSAKSQTGGAS